MNKEQERPLVTFVLLSYNQERFILDAVKAALNQDYSNLEIILSDDCSADSTFEVINSVVSEYVGNHDIKVNRNPVNLGLAKHFSQIISRATGEIIVVAAGDDISLPARVSKTVKMLCSSPEATFASFTDVIIDENGKAKSKPIKEKKVKVRKATLDDYIAGSSPRLSGASRGFKKSIFDVFGELNANCPTEDTPTILRGLMIGHALVSSEPGILYRQHGNNLSRPASIHAMAIDEIKKQYIQDAGLAFSSGMISKNTLINIHDWAEKSLRRRVFLSELYGTPNKLKFILLKLLPNKDFKLREKAGILFRSI